MEHRLKYIIVQKIKAVESYMNEVRSFVDFNEWLRTSIYQYNILDKSSKIKSGRLMSDIDCYMDNGVIEGLWRMIKEKYVWYIWFQQWKKDWAGPGR